MVGRTPRRIAYPRWTLATATCSGGAGQPLAWPFRLPRGVGNSCSEAVERSDRLHEQGTRQSATAAASLAGLLGTARSDRDFGTRGDGWPPRISRWWANDSSDSPSAVSARGNGSDLTKRFKSNIWRRRRVETLYAKIGAASGAVTRTPRFDCDGTVLRRRCSANRPAQRTREARVTRLNVHRIVQGGEP
jgi:hypothetical protein